MSKFKKGISMFLSLTLVMACFSISVMAGGGDIDENPISTTYTLKLSTEGNGSLTASLSNGGSTDATGDKLALTQDSTNKYLYSVGLPGTPDSVTADSTELTIVIPKQSGASMLEITATPAPGYAFDRLVDSAGKVLRSGAYNYHYYFFMHDLQKTSENVVLKAYFVANANYVHPTPEAVAANCMVSIMRSAKGGKVNASEKIGENGIPRDMEYETLNPPANFSDELVTKGHRLKKGDFLTLEAIPDSGYKFVGWHLLDNMQNKTKLTDDTKMTVTVEGDLAYLALFEPGTSTPSTATTSTSSAPTTAPAGKIITVTLDGEALTFDQSPVNESGRVLLPLKAIADAAGAESVDWDAATKSLTIIKGDTAIKLTIDDPIAYVNDKPITLDVPARIINGRTLVPVGFVSTSLNLTVVWDGPTNTVILTSK